MPLEAVVLPKSFGFAGNVPSRFTGLTTATSGRGGATSWRRRDLAI